MTLPPIGRRAFLAGSAVVALPDAATGAMSQRGTTFRAVDLRTMQTDTPLAVHDPRPSLSWRVEGAGARQRAYRIEVAGTAEALAAGRADLWDSGTVTSSQSVGIAYAGKPLASRQRCFWRVTLWNDAAVMSVPDEVGRWEMGLLRAEDWHGDWLAAESDEDRITRDRGAIWVSAAGTGQEARPAYRLPFACAAGEVRVIVQCSGRLIAVTLDGKPLTLIDRGSLPEVKAPVAEVRVPVAAGRHVLGVVALPEPGLAIAAQVRLPDGKAIGSGWQVRSAPAAGWQLPDAAQEGWVPAIAVDPQPWFRMPPGPAHMLRRRFTVGREHRGARLYVAVLGGYDIWINGRRANDDTLQTEPADYGDHIPYRVYDVGALLRPGDNVVAAMVADGHYASYLLQSGRYAYGPPPRRIRVQLEIEDRGGGRRSVVAGDRRWTGRAAALRRSEIYHGEDWDRRIEPDGWTAPGFDDAAWERVRAAPVPPGELRGRIVQPVRITRTLVPVSLAAIGEKRHRVDFGQNFAGRVRLRVRGAAGDTVVVRHAEILDAKGAIDVRNLRAARATDTYILRGDAGGEVLEPRFTYQGFRHVEIDGARDLTADAVTGLVMHSDLPETGTFRTDQPVVQKLWLNTLWSQRSNFMGWPTDCPQRDERVAWTGDANVFWDTAAYNMDVAAFTAAFMTALRDSQGAGGAFPVWAPNVHTGRFAPTEATPGWADAGVMLPFISYRRYGDRAIVDASWAAMTRYVEGVLKDNPGGLWQQKRGADFGDWLSLDARDPGDETTPRTLVATAMLARSVSHMAQMATWTGRAADAARWTAERARIGAAFARAFVVADGTVGNASHAGYILALDADLVPAALRSRAATLLAADIRRRGTLLSTGFLGTPVALDVLADTGHVDLAYDLLLRTAYPSWGYMVTRGATTIWERWNGDVGDATMNSFNHYALGAVCGFLYRRVAGLQPATPGFARARIAPLPDARMGRAGCTYDSVRGRFTTDWTLAAGRLTLSVEIPPNTVAEVRIPATRDARIAEGGTPIERRPGITVLHRDAAAMTVEVGPGRHVFTT